jgi:glycosyltransferase involved in cell wall biosynthesis
LPDKIYDHFKNIFYQKIYLHNEKVKLNRRKFKKLPQGINLFIYDLKSSSNKVAHILKQALDNTKIPYHTFDLCDLEKCKSEFKNKKLYNINLVVYHAASNTSMAMLYLGLNAKKYFNIAYFAWELAELPDSYYSSLSMFHEIWSISSFCTAAVAKKSIVPVLTVPHFADPNKAIIKNGRNHFKIDNDVFLFMFAYDCTSYISRKNPQAVVKAFLKAFSPKDRNVGLVLKLNYSNKHKKHVKELKKILSSYPYIYFIEKYLSDVEMRTLIQTSNAVVSLHRSEGFGLLPLEAMSLGTPVISTAWSGNMEYMTHMNTALVSYKLIPVNGKYVGSKPGDSLVWANPNIDEAAIYMRRMVSDQVWREKLIIEGKYTVSKYFNPENISKIIHDRLRFLKLID